MTALISFLGGIRATIITGIALLLLLALGVQTARLGASERGHDKYVSRVQAATLKASQLAAEAAKRAAEARQEYYATLSKADAAYAAGRESALNYQNTVVADLKSGNVRLRNEWQACMSRPHQVGTAGTATGVGQEATAVPAEAFGRVLRVGADADNEITWYQQALTATRALYEKCANPVASP